MFETSTFSPKDISPLNTQAKFEINDIEQTLLQSEPELPAYFAFSWSNIRFEAKVVAAKTGTILHLTGELAPIPYTAEQGERRGTLKALCDPRVRLPSGHYFQTKRQWVGYSMKHPIPAPVTGARILETTATALLQARTYFAVAKEPELLDEQIEPASD